MGRDFGTAGEKIGQDFSRLGKQVGEGTGLGLSVVHGLVEDHRGEIAIERSAPGEGTRICIRLPLQARMGSPPPRAVGLTS